MSILLVSLGTGLAILFLTSVHEAIQKRLGEQARTAGVRRIAWRGMSGQKKARPGAQK